MTKWCNNKIDTTYIPKFLNTKKYLKQTIVLLIPILLFAEPGFFQETYKTKTFITPSRWIDKVLTQESTTVTITFDLSGNAYKVLPTIYGWNENSTMGKDLLNDEYYGLKHIRKANIHSLRLPGGSWSNQWLWDGINHWGDNLKDNYLNTGVMSHPTHTWNYSTDQLLKICEEIDAEPQICVNFALSRFINAPDAIEQSAHYAAQWVRNVNIEKNLGVTYWEVGNENFGSWEKGFIVDGDTITAEMYGKGFCVFADSMKSADPSIKIGAVVLGQESCDVPNWTPIVLKEVQDHADFIVIHDYFNWKANADYITTTEILNGITQIRENREYLEQSIEHHTQKDADSLPIAMTEYNIFGGWKNSSFLGGLFLSRALCEFTIEGYGLANTWCMVGGETNQSSDMGILTYIEDNVQQYTPRSSFFPFYYSAQYLGDEMIPSSSSNSEVSVYVSRFSSGDYGFIATNTSANDEIIELTLPNVNTLYWHSIEGDSLTAKSFRINGVDSETGYYGPLSYDTIAPYKSTISEVIKCLIPKFSMNYFAATNNNEPSSIHCINRDPEHLSININNNIFIFSLPIESLELYQPNGKCIISEDFKTGKQIITLNKKLTKGVYFIKAYINRKLLISKKIILR